MPPPIFAHLGHWYVSLPVFMGPVLLLVVALKIQTWRERRAGPRRASARAGVTVTRGETSTTVAVSGPLDYPALLTIEAELGEARQPLPELLLDLHQVTSAGDPAVWELCDALARARTRVRISALVGSDEVANTLRAAFAVEGVRVVEEAL